MSNAHDFVMTSASTSGAVSRRSVSDKLILLIVGVQLQWNPVTGQNVTCYRVYYAPRRELTCSPTARAWPRAQTSYTVTGLAGARRYFFAVTATNSLGKESGYSNEASLDMP